MNAHADGDRTGEVLSFYKTLLRELKPDDVVADIGAHIGLFTLHVAPLVGQVVAFEPEPANWVQLVCAVAASGQQNVNCRNVAITDSDAPTVKLWLSRVEDMQHSTATEQEGGAFTVVDNLHFRDMVRQYTPTVLKLDCEGAEWGILRTYPFLPSVKMITAELHGMPGDHLQVLQRFAELNGYRYAVTHYTLELYKLEAWRV